MELNAALSFAAAVLVWVLIPGPAVLMIVGRSLSTGFRSSVSLICGLMLGDLFYMALVFFGLSALGQVMGELFTIVRIGAALYLIYLGVSLWRKRPDAPPPAPATRGDALRIFATGFGFTLGNPKAILFHLGFLPTFFDIPSLAAGEALVIMALFLAMLGGAFAAYALAASRASAFMRRPSRLRILNRTAGALLIGAGAVALVKRG